MKDANSKRIVFWGIMFLITLVCAILGYMNYTKGYGEKGASRVLLVPISEKFNSLYPNMTSKVTLDGITITTGDKTKYKFISENYNSIATIVLTYSKGDSKAEECVKAILETISVIQGNTHGLLTSKYDYSKFNSTSIMQGVTIGINSEDTSKMEARINLSANLYKTLLVTNNLENEAIDTLFDTLTTNGKVEYNENSVLMYIETSEKTYDIYTISEINNETNNLLLDITNKLNNEAYRKMLSNNENFKEVKTDETYKIELNATISNTNIFEGEGSITKISINK